MFHKGDVKKGDFAFKEFYISQQHVGLKVTTDGILLGALVDLKPSDHKILEIGAGTGYVSLMVAQRYSHVQIDAVELQESACSVCFDNFCNSKFSSRVRIIHGAVQTFCCPENQGQYDHIFSNPPYFHRSLSSEDTCKHLSRHTETLSHLALLDSAKHLLKPEGHLTIVLPYLIAIQLLRNTMDWHVNKCSLVRDKQLLPRLAIIELCQEKDSACSYTNLNLYSSDKSDQYSAEYIDLTKEFYLEE